MGDFVRIAGYQWPSGIMARFSEFKSYYNAKIN